MMDDEISTGSSKFRADFLIETQILPEPYCHVFAKYSHFNEVQTASFENVFQSVMVLNN